MDLLTKAKQELRDIDQRIAELLRRKNDLQAFVATGERLFGSTQSPSSLVEVAAAVAASTRGFAQAMVEHNAREKTKKAQILEVVESAIPPGTYKPVRELVELVQARGIDLGGDPISAVSVLLSRDDRFISERAKGGWTMIDPNKEETPRGAATPAGSDLLDLN